MLTPWRSSAAAFERILEQHGVNADAVADMDVAWAAFQEFAQMPLQGVELTEDDGDGFIVEWGCWSWNAGKPAISLGRLLAVADGEDHDEHQQPQYWKVELQVRFAADPSWGDIDSLGVQDTGFDFAEIGPLRAAALNEAHDLIQSFPCLASMWKAQPTGSSVTMEQAD